MVRGEAALPGLARRNAGRRVTLGWGLAWCPAGAAERVPGAAGIASAAVTAGLRLRETTVSAATGTPTAGEEAGAGAAALSKTDSRWVRPGTWEAVRPRLTLPRPLLHH